MGTPLMLHCNLLTTSDYPLEGFMSSHGKANTHPILLIGTENQTFPSLQKVHLFVL